MEERQAKQGPATRSAPPSSSIVSVKVAQLFYYVPGNRDHGQDEQFIIMFASGSKKTAHFDLLKCSKTNSFVFSASTLPRIARKYWQIKENVKPRSLALEGFRNLVDDDYFDDAPASSTPDSPFYKPSAEDLDHLDWWDQDITAISSSPLPQQNTTSTSVFTQWKSAFCVIFGNTKRDAFLRLVPPFKIQSLFTFIMDRFGKAKITPQESQLFQRQIDECISGIWSYLETISKHDKQVKLRTQGIDHRRIKTFQVDILDTIVENSVMLIDGVREVLGYFCRTLAKDCAKIRTSQEHFLQCTGFKDSLFLSFAIPKWFLLTTNPTKHPKWDAVSFKNTFCLIGNRFKDTRNLCVHNTNLTHPKCTVAEVLLGFAMIAAMSNSIRLNDYDDSLRKSNWYQ